MALPASARQGVFEGRYAAPSSHQVPPAERCNALYSVKALEPIASCKRPVTRHEIGIKKFGVSWPQCVPTAQCDTFSHRDTQVATRRSCSAPGSAGVVLKSSPYDRPLINMRTRICRRPLQMVFQACIRECVAL